jgi:hypothetical protein
MREIRGVGSEPQLQRRWFHDEYFDLFVWQDAAGALARFELCYGRDADERALVWLGEGRYFHDGAPGAATDVPELLRRFERAGAGLPEGMRREVRARLQDYAGRGIALSRRTRFRRAPWQQRGARARQDKGAAREA